MTYICYLITNGPRTYVGITNNFGRRLRQHNGEICGGARSTSRRAIVGQPWRFAACVRGIDEHNDALSFEKCVHLASRPGRHRSKAQICGVENRVRIMQQILAKFKRGEYTNKTTGQVRDASKWEFTLEDPLAHPTSTADASPLPPSPPSPDASNQSDCDLPSSSPSSLLYPLSVSLPVLNPQPTPGSTDYPLVLDCLSDHN